MTRLILLLALALFALSSPAQLPWHSMYAPTLGDTVAYLVYPARPLPDAAPWVYLLDGRKLVDHGFLEEIQNLEQQGRIPECRYVFVSTIVASPEPRDRREAYFFRNPDYLAFFERTLVPTVEPGLPPTRRALVGVSFGGLCGAYFSAHSSLFDHYALLSPVTYPAPELLNDLAFSRQTGLSFFISTGHHDAEAYAVPLANSLEAQGHWVKFVRTEGGHDFENWRGQLEGVLEFVGEEK